MLIAAGLHEAAEDLTHEVVIGFLLELQVFAVLNVPVKLFWAISSQLLYCSLNLFLFDTIVLVVLVFAGKSLPGQTAFKKVEQNVANGLHIVSARLLYANVSVNGGIPGRACQRFIVTVRNVLASFCILVPFRKTKVNQKDRSSLRSVAHQKVVRLHVSVDEVVCMHILQSRDHLISQHAYCLQCKLASAILEQVF